MILILKTKDGQRREIDIVSLEDNVSDRITLSYFTDYTFLQRIQILKSEIESIEFLNYAPRGNELSSQRENSQTPTNGVDTTKHNTE